MIKIEVEDYCHRCLNFEAEVEKPVSIYTDRDCVHLSDIIIRCEHRQRCRNIAQYIEKSNKKRDNIDKKE